MKWYFCLNEEGLLGFAEIVLVAAHSALQHTDLEAHLLYDGPENAITEYLTSIGVQVHHHRSSIAPLLDNAKSQPGYNPSVARGAYLRLDIPIVETSDSFVLYTDCDVIFFSNPNIENYKPAILAASPEYASTATTPIPYNKIFNSGVMVLNVKEFFNERDELVDFAKRNDFYFHGDGGYYDQGALNKFFDGRWDQLPQSLNWRPFGGASTPPKILHFHGTKPYELAYILAGKTGPQHIRPVAKQFFDLQPFAYLMACKAYLAHLPADAEKLVAAASPATTGFVTFGRERAHEAIAALRQELTNRQTDPLMVTDPAASG